MGHEDRQGRNGCAARNEMLIYLGLFAKSGKSWTRTVAWAIVQMSRNSFIRNSRRLPHRGDDTVCLAAEWHTRRRYSINAHQRFQQFLALLSSHRRSNLIRRTGEKRKGNGAAD